MKLRIGDNVVTITAKNDYNIGQDTLRFLNTLCCVFGEASRFNEEYGFNAVAKEYRDCCNEIYEFLNARGLYK